MFDKEIQPRTRIEQLLNKIAENVGEKGSSKSNKFIVTFSGETDNDNDPPTCDCTYEEIVEAFDEGYDVEGRYGNFILRLQRCTPTFVEFALYYYATFGEATWYGICAMVESNDTVSIYLGGDV